MLPDSLTTRASFTHGFPYYPYPNLPMALQSVVNRCTNSGHRLAHLFVSVKVLGLRILYIAKRFAKRAQAVGEAAGRA
jgi:hypothetical protein